MGSCSVPSGNTGDQQVKLCPSCYLKAEKAGEQLTLFDVCVQEECMNGIHENYLPHWAQRMSQQEAEYWKNHPKNNTRRQPA